MSESQALSISGVTVGRVLNAVAVVCGLFACVVAAAMWPAFLIIIAGIATDAILTATAILMGIAREQRANRTTSASATSTPAA